jgi:DNA-binding NtrC family response regulator
VAILILTAIQRKNRIMTEDNSRPIRLLLVDDEEDLVTFLAHRLGKRGLDVTTALAGEEALDAAEEKIFDVAVVDLKMPDMDGITVIEELKRMQPFVEVLMLTGHGSHDSAWEAGRLHAFRYIMKPCDFDELLDLVQTAAVNRRQQMKEEFEAKLNELNTRMISPRELIQEGDRLRREYEQD